jgi:hypothetical protein
VSTKYYTLRTSDYFTANNVKQVTVSKQLRNSKQGKVYASFFFSMRKTHQKPKVFLL